MFIKAFHLSYFDKYVYILGVVLIRYLTKPVVFANQHLNALKQVSEVTEEIIDDVGTAEGHY